MRSAFCFLVTRHFEHPSRSFPTLCSYPISAVLKDNESNDWYSTEETWFKEQRVANMIWGKVESLLAGKFDFRKDLRTYLQVQSRRSFEVWSKIYPLFAIGDMKPEPSCCCFISPVKAKVYTHMRVSTPLILSLTPRLNAAKPGSRILTTSAKSLACGPTIFLDCRTGTPG